MEENEYLEQYLKMVMQQEPIVESSTDDEEFQNLASNNSMMRECLSVLARNSKGRLVFSVANFSDKKLKKLDGLETFIHLQKLNLSNNRICSLPQLSKTVDLTSIDLTNNLITIFPDCLCKLPLTELRIGKNKLTAFPDFAEFPQLCILDISHNEIQSLHNTSVSSNLQCLDVSHNPLNGDITDIKSFPKAKRLSANNCGASTDSLFPAFNLVQSLNANRGTLTSLRILNNFTNLKELDVAFNRLAKLSELRFIEHLQFLTKLDLSGNTCQKSKFYKRRVLHILPSLTELDGCQVGAQQHVEAFVFYGGDLEMRKQIFSHYLPDEEFVDYRFENSEMIANELDDQLDGTVADFFIF